MNPVLFASPVMLAPLQGLLRWIKSTPLHEPCVPVHSALETSERVLGSVGNKLHSAACISSGINLPHKPLRVVRIVEADQSATQVGRMVISGRMADVCAELDRLAAREAALH